MPEAGKLFRVTERTVRNWEAGRVAVPYAAFKLLRVLRGGELPGRAWKGYRLQGGTLWSPEGRPFHAHDATWWMLTVRMAHGFVAARQQAHAAQAASARALAPVPLPVLASILREPVGYPGLAANSAEPLPRPHTPPPTGGETSAFGAAVSAADPPYSNTGVNQSSSAWLNAGASL